MKISSTLALEAPNTAATLLRGSIPEGIRRSAQMGFDGVEIQLCLRDDNLPDFEAIREDCNRRNLSVVAWGTGSLFVREGLNLIDDDPAVIQETLRRLGLYIDGAAVCGGKVIVGCTRGNVDPARYEELEARLADSLRILSKTAAAKGITLIIEPINRYENNYLATGQSVVDLIRKYGLEGVQVLLDTFHMNIEERDFYGAIRDAGPLLGHFHAVDNTRLVPGTGMFDYPRIIQTLKDVGYNGWLSLEATIEKDENAEAAAGLAYLRRMI